MQDIGITKDGEAHSISGSGSVKTGNGMSATSGAK